MLCGRSTSNSAGREASLTPHCTNECEIAKRNARLAEALGINPDMHKTNRDVVYSDELVTFTRHNGKFVELVEKTFAEYVLEIGSSTRSKGKTNMWIIQVRVV